MSRGRRRSRGWRSARSQGQRSACSHHLVPSIRPNLLKMTTLRFRSPSSSTLPSPLPTTSEGCSSLDLARHSIRLGNSFTLPASNSGPRLSAPLPYPPGSEGCLLRRQQQEAWATWILTLRDLWHRLLHECTAVTALMQNLPLVLYACRPTGCPLHVQQSAVMVAHISDDYLGQIRDLLEPIQTLLRILGSPDELTRQDVDHLHDLKWPSIDADNDWNLLGAFLEPIDQYLREHVTPAPGPAWNVKIAPTDSPDLPDCSSP